jgi:hypothetical protein
MSTTIRKVLNAYWIVAILGFVLNIVYSVLQYVQLYEPADTYQTLYFADILESTLRTASYYLFYGIVGECLFHISESLGLLAKKRSVDSEQQ